MTTSKPEVVAHRGFAGAYPENTVQAIEAALRAGFSWVEFDVQLSADSVPVVLHDTNLLRTAGIDASALKLTAAQLRRMEVNETARLGNRFHGIRIPLLSDVLATIKAWPQAHAFVEVKRESIAARGLRNTVARIVTDIQQSGASAQCTLISFDVAALEVARELGLHSIGWVLPAYDDNTKAIAFKLAADFIFCDHRILPAAPEPLWQASWQWAIYEVASRTLSMSLAAQGAHMIETMQLDVFTDSAIMPA